MRAPRPVLRVAAALGLTVALAALTGSPAAVSAGHRPAASSKAEVTLAPGLLRHHGRWFTDAQGRVVIVHGLNLVAKKAPYRQAAQGISADDARFLQAHGFTAVRFGLLMEAVEPKPGKFDAAYLKSVTKSIHLLSRYGIRSLVDFHQDLYNEKFQGEGLPGWMVKDDGLPNLPQAGFPGNYFSNQALNRTFDNFWADVKGPKGIGLQEWYAGAWKHVAKRFRHDPAVLGYDIFNEPWPGTGWQLCFAPNVGCPDFDKTKLKPFTHRVIAAIHSVDPTHIAFYEPAQMFSEGSPSFVGTPATSATGFSFHTYCTATVGAPDTPPTRAVCDNRERLALDNGVTQGKQAKAVVLLSEFGATSNTAELTHVRDESDARDVPWLEWAYCACDDPTGAGKVEALVYDPKKKLTGNNVNHSSLNLLDEPYPVAVAGTPGPFSFNNNSRVFTFTYSSKSVAGKHAARGTTVIFPSRLHYPKGYTVTATGAHVVSASRDRLVVRAEPGVHEVSVRIRPGVRHTSSGGGRSSTTVGVTTGSGSNGSTVSRGVKAGGSLARTGAPLGLIGAIGSLLTIAALGCRRVRLRLTT